MVIGAGCADVAGAGDSRANAVVLGNGVIYVAGWASNGANDDAVLLGIH